MIQTHMKREHKFLCFGFIVVAGMCHLVFYSEYYRQTVYSEYFRQTVYSEYYRQTVCSEYYRQTVCSEYYIQDVAEQSKITEPVSQIPRIFVCITFLSEKCSLAKIIATNLFPNSTVIDYVGQESTANDVLLSVCGCNHADLFKGVILYFDNAAGQLYLPGLKERKVIYIGSTLPSPESLVLHQLDICFAVTSAYMVFNITGLSHLKDYTKDTDKRYSAIYLSNYMSENSETANVIQSINTTIISIGGQPLAVKSYLDLINGSLENFQNAIDIIKRYRYTLIVENKNANGYVGEKVLLSILAGSIPVYVGTKDIFKLFNKDVIIYLDLGYPQKAIDWIVFLEKNPTAYMEILNLPVLKTNKWFSKGNTSVDRSRQNVFRILIENAIKNGQKRFNKDTSKLDSELRYSTITKLEKEPVPFYMYDDPDITLDNLENYCSKPALFSDKTDIALIKLFRNHPWRTNDTSKAKLFVIPTPLYESYTCNPKTHLVRLEKSLSALTSNEHFKRFQGRNHLLLAYHWRFGYSSPDIVITKNWWKVLKEVTCTRFEYYGMSNWENFTAYDERRIPLSLFTQKFENTKRTIVVSYNVWEGINITIPDYNEWIKRPNFLWYHSRKSISPHSNIPLAFLDFTNKGGTKLRHLPIEKKHLLSGDIGYEIENKRWRSGWKNSRFCFVIRGDTPSSHAFSSALASGCIPVIISDTFDLVAMPLKDLIPVDSIAIRIDESFFLKHTDSLLSKLKSIPEHKLRTTLSNIKFVQHVLLLPYPNSTFPNLILHEFQDKVDNVFSVH